MTDWKTSSVRCICFSCPLEAASVKSWLRLPYTSPLTLQTEQVCAHQSLFSLCINMFLQKKKKKPATAADSRRQLSGANRGQGAKNLAAFSFLLRQMAGWEIRLPSPKLLRAQYAFFCQYESLAKGFSNLWSSVLTTGKCSYVLHSGVHSHLIAQAWSTHTAK